MEENEQTEQTRTNGDYNRAALKRHALKVSEETRNGKFTRVSEEFLIWVEAEIESAIRKLRVPVQAFNGREVDTVEDFLTGAGKKKLCEAFNIWVASTIHRKTKDVRTGKTL